MHLASRAFENGGRIPGRFTCDGDNEMPPLEWTGVPPEARSLALVCSDPDAPSGTFHHWAVYDIPPDVRHLPERKCAGMREAVNDFGRTGYGGPCPPRGHGSHRYCFRLYATPWIFRRSAWARRPAAGRSSASPTSTPLQKPTSSGFTLEIETFGGLAARASRSRTCR